MNPPPISCFRQSFCHICVYGRFLSLPISCLFSRSIRLMTAPEFAWRGTGETAKKTAEMRDIPGAAVIGDLLNRPLRRAQQTAGVEDAQTLQVPDRAHLRLRLKMPLKRTLRHPRAPRQALHRELGVEADSPRRFRPPAETPSATVKRNSTLCGSAF